MCPSCFCTTLCNLAGIWLSHLKEQIVQPHIQAAPFSVKGRKIAGSTQKLLYFAFHVCFHLCALQLFKMTGFTQPTQIYFLSIFSFFFFFSSSIFFSQREVIKEVFVFPSDTPWDWLRGEARVCASSVPQMLSSTLDLQSHSCGDTGHRQVTLSFSTGKGNAVPSLQLLWQKTWGKPLLFQV